MSQPDFELDFELVSRNSFTPELTNKEILPDTPLCIFGQYSNLAAEITGESNDMHYSKNPIVGRSLYKRESPRRERAPEAGPVITEIYI